MMIGMMTLSGSWEAIGDQFIRGLTHGFHIHILKSHQSSRDSRTLIILV